MLQATVMQVGMAVCREHEVTQNTVAVTMFCHTHSHAQTHECSTHALAWLRVPFYCRCAVYDQQVQQPQQHTEPHVANTLRTRDTQSSTTRRQHPLVRLIQGVQNGPDQKRVPQRLQAALCTTLGRCSDWCKRCRRVRGRFGAGSRQGRPRGTRAGRCRSPGTDRPSPSHGSSLALRARGWLLA